MSFVRTILAASFLSLSVCATAEDDATVQRWVAHPDKSELSFTATQEGTQFGGRFQQFNAGLELLPADEGIGLLQISARIQLASVDTQYRDRDDYLVQQDWFYVDMWPEAVFQSAAIRQLGGNRFIADGTLSLRGISRDVSVELELNLEENGERGKLLGSAALNRLDFGVGQGDWASTEWVGDEVKVTFDLYILRAFE
jgi:polyisoprenoid-binding protein YceI